MKRDSVFTMFEKHYFFEIVQNFEIFIKNNLMFYNNKIDNYFEKNKEINNFK